MNRTLGQDRAVVRTRGGRAGALVIAVALVAGAPQHSVAQDGSAPAGARPLTVTMGPRGNEWKRAFNPFRDDTDTRWPATAGVYEPLVVYSRATRSFVPWLATAHRWGPDNMTLRFSIRRGVVWSDGAAFSVRDVLFTFDLMRRFPALDR